MRFRKRIFLFVTVCLATVYILLNFFVYHKFSKNEGPPFDRYIFSDKLLGLSQDANYFKNSHISEGSCNDHRLPFQTDVQMFNLYKELKFDNIDGGAWKQGWNIQINKARWNAKNKLKVFVVPHSHNDPGWKRTFEQYYESQTRNIFNNMVTKLSEDPRRKFIWAEVSYLSLWWAEVPAEYRQRFRRLLENGQIEVVSGGWVMPDEANSHYYSIIQELTHGHQWLHKHLKYAPKRSWCIDPFGTSPTMPFLLKHFGLDSLVIQRTHYSVKKHLAKTKQLEFRWRQLWDGSGKLDFFTHMMPFYTYDIPHTCGPDPAVCCQFDFRRSFQSGLLCPWKKQPQLITSKNVAFRAEMLLEQYRKKAELYSTNVLLVPLGDDFRYDIDSEWDLQYQNYQKLFDAMNSNPSMYVEAKFGTLEDYFTAVMEEKTQESFPSLSGDFFTYADRDDHYWSGYFTSRPYYKRMDRELISYLRAAEILHAISWKSSPSKYSDWMLSDSAGFITHLQNARASLSLFQHHDGITGTAKDYVVTDYADKLQRGMMGSQHVMQQSLNFLLNFEKSSYQPAPDLVYFDLKKSRKTPSGDSKLEVLKVSDSSPTRRIVVFNSLTWKRVEIVSVKIESYKNIEVYDENDHPVFYQISPFCEINDHSSHCFLLHFKVEVKPLSVRTYFLKYAVDVSNRNNLASLNILNTKGGLEFGGLKDFMKYDNPVSDFSIQNEKLSVTFRPDDGLMKAITMKTYDLTIPVHLNFIKYTCKHSREMCGAYLFLPDGNGRSVNCANPLVKIIEGKLVSTVIAYCDFVIHAVTVYNCSGSEEYNVEIQNLVDIKTETNFEIAMKLSTSIKNDGIFYTDLNGLQIIKRQYLSKIPLQGNYYPMPSSIYIEDDNARLTVVSAQPLGAASLSEGEIEIMQDRRLKQDDNLGLGQGVLDNRPILHIFKLALDKRMLNCRKIPDTHPAGYLSVVPYLALNSILYPLMLFVQTDVEENQKDLSAEYNFKGLQESFSIDVHIVTMTTIVDTQDVGVVLHRTDLDTCFYQEYKNYPLNSGVIDVSSYIPIGENDAVYFSSPSFIRKENENRLNKSTSFPLCAMDLAAFYVTNNN